MCSICSLAAQSPDLRNWPAPLYWFAGEESGAFKGERAGAISGQLPLVAVTPCRVMDTRPEYAVLGFHGPFGAPVLGSGQQRDVPIPQSSCGVPANARAYSLNITVVPQGQLQFLSVWPAGVTRPNVSTLNSYSGAIVANAAVVPAGTNGSISVYVTEPSHVIIDINGYYVDLAVTGVSGPTGPPGPTGPTGPSGPTGLTGATGRSVLPAQRDLPARREPREPLATRDLLARPEPQEPQEPQELLAPPGPPGPPGPPDRLAPLVRRDPPGYRAMSGCPQCRRSFPVPW